MQTIQKNVPLHSQVADLLSEWIISGEYAPGALLPGERELGETLGVSRTVVREAVKNLESRRLVRIEHGRGTVVQKADGKPVADSLRVALRRGAHVPEDLLEVRHSLAELLVESRRASFAGPAMMKRRLRQHGEIFEAIRRADSAEAMAAMERHLGDTGEDLQRRRR